jgi:hypothetical protein
MRWIDAVELGKQAGTSTHDFEVALYYVRNDIYLGSVTKIAGCPVNYQIKGEKLPFDAASVDEAKTKVEQFFDKNRRKS